MKKQSINNIRLGVFVLTGLTILVVSLYLIGLNQNFFGSSFSLKARFRNVNGLMPGNNVRFSGIQCGTVKSIEIINDTTIEVLMLIHEKTGIHIRSNAWASIGSEGLMGNKVIDITQGSAGSAPIANGDLLQILNEDGINDLMGDLTATGNNAHDISVNLQQTAARLNNSQSLNKLLTDTTLVQDLDQTLKNLRELSLVLKYTSGDAEHIINNIRNGHGAAGVLLSDKNAEDDINTFVNRMRTAAEHADRLVQTLDSTGIELQNSLKRPGSLAFLLLEDSIASGRVINTLQNIETGTKAFSEDMEALKHNILLRGYFKR